MTDATETDLRIEALRAAVNTRTPNVVHEAEKFLKFLKAGELAADAAALARVLPSAPEVVEAVVEKAGQKAKRGGKA